MIWPNYLLMSFLNALKLVKSNYMKNILKITLLLFLTIGCKKEAKNGTSGVYYTDLFLEDSVITSYFEANPENESIKNSVDLFYQNRDFQYAWFNKKGMTQAVPNFYNQLFNYSNDFNDKSFNIEQIDSLITLVKTQKSDVEVATKRIENLELLLTTTFFKYSKKAYGGINKTAHQLDWFIPRNKKNYQVLLDSLILKDANDKTSEPVNLYYSKLKEKLHLYRDIQKKGGFPIIKMDKELLYVSQSDSCLLKVKQRLLLTRDLKSNDKTILFTEDLAKAVANFQQRLGLPENGKLDAKTVTELNKTVEFRIKQMMINLERLRWVPVEIEKDYLLVNIPEYKLHVIENEKIVWEANVIVGQAAKQTTIFKGNISTLVLNPYWNIPNSIIIDEILPKLKQNSNYLSKNNMEVVSGEEVMDASEIDWNKYTETVPFQIRQKPGKNNSLGKMKFLFPNNYNIYLHDTPAKELFNSRKRDFSHGCIRVENPKKLALYLLRNNEAWSPEKVAAILATDENKEIAIQPKLPVYIVYFTAWVDSNGNLNFRNDIYNLDEQLAKEIFSEE